MSSQSMINVDSNGDRLKTNILISGYLRNCGKKYGLLIPDDMTSICFEYRLIEVCDVWDTKYNANLIDSQTVTFQQNYSSVYGTHSVGQGIYSWQLKFKSDNVSLRIGIIEDDEDMLLKYSNTSLYGNTANRAYVWSYNGAMYY